MRVSGSAPARAVPAGSSDGDGRRRIRHHAELQVRGVRSVRTPETADRAPPARAYGTSRSGASFPILCRSPVYRTRRLHPDSGYAQTAVARADTRPAPERRPGPVTTSLRSPIRQDPTAVAPGTGTRSDPGRAASGSGTREAQYPRSSRMRATIAARARSSGSCPW